MGQVVLRAQHFYCTYSVTGRRTSCRRPLQQPGPHWRPKRTVVKIGKYESVESHPNSNNNKKNNDSNKNKKINDKKRRHNNTRSRAGHTAHTHPITRETASPQQPVKARCAVRSHTALRGGAWHPPRHRHHSSRTAPVLQFVLTAPVPLPHESLLHAR